MADPTQNNAAAALHDIHKSDEKKGATVHSFDPDASPADKARSAGKAAAGLKPDYGAAAQSSEGREVTISTGPQAVPTITIEDVDHAAKANAGAAASPSELNGGPMPGAMPAGPAPAIPDWYRVGWRAVSGVDAAPAEGEERDKRILSQVLSELYYGEFYHNAAVIFFAVAMTHYMTIFRLGWGWLTILLATCATYYTTSIHRVRTRARDDMQRELIKNHLATEHESAEWINNFLDRFWLIYEPVLSETIVSSVDQILSASTPPFLDSIRLSTFTLGTKAPRIDRVRTFPRTSDDVVLMDWGISFTPNDVSDLTPRQAAGKVNPKIVLAIRVGKGLATAAMPILLEDISFSGLMRIKLKLVTNFPHVQVVEMSFLEKPIFDYVLKPIGGETFGFDIGNIPGLSSFIRDQVHANLGPMMYDPNVFTLNLEQLLSGAPLDAAVGVLQVHISSARGLKATKIGGGVPDPYITLSINNRAVLAKTVHKPSTTNPHFSSTHYLLLTSANMTEALTLGVWDYNEHRKDNDLGSANYDLSSLHEDAVQEGLSLPILKDGKDKGEVKFDLSWYPVLTPKKLADGQLEPPPETKVGIVRLVVHQAKELDHSKSLSGELNPFAKVISNTSEVHKTPKFKHTNSPIWESPCEFLVTDKAKTTVSIKVIDDRDFLKDPVVGHVSVKLEDLLEAKTKQVDWFPLSGCKSGKVRMSAEWKPVAMAGSIHGAGEYVPPIGIIRLWMQKATDVKNVEAALGGKSDPYVRVLLKSDIMARTEVIDNNLNPEWDQILYIPVHSLKETLLLECMDYQHLTKDRSLGSVELKISDLARESEGGRLPHVSTGKKTVADPIRLDGGNVYKGKLHYVAEFVPALNIQGVKFDGQDVLSETASSASGSLDGNTMADSVTYKVPASPTSPTSPALHNDPAPAHENADPAAAHGNGAANGEPTDGYHVGDGVPNGDGAAHSKESSVDAPIQLSHTELMKYQSGVIVFNIISGRLAKKARLEILLDDGYWPSVGLEKTKSTTVKWDHVGEGFVKELDFSRLTLRLNEHPEGDRDDIIAEYKCFTKAFLEEALDKKAEFTLTNEDGRYQSQVLIMAKYVPAEIKLEPRESVNNQGTLRVTLIDGREIRGADRSGKSDPYAVFTLNDQKIFKSEVVKKTLAPVWNEEFTVDVPSRVAAKFSLELFDWNKIEQAKSLGGGKIDLSNLEPFELTERIVALSSDKHGDKGEVRIRLMFEPRIIAKARKGTTFASAGRALTQVGGLPLGATKGLVHGAKGLFKKGSSADSHEDDEPMPVDPPATQVSQPVGAAANGATPFPTSTLGTGTPPHEVGTLKVHVVGAKDISGPVPGEAVKPYVVLRMGEKEYKTKHTGSKTHAPEWNEAFSYVVGPETRTLLAYVFSHHKFGKDILIGEAEIDIWKHIQANAPSPIKSSDVRVELRSGQGTLQLQLDFELGLKRQTSSSFSSNRSPHASPSRFSLGRKPDDS